MISNPQFPSVPESDSVNNKEVIISQPETVLPQEEAPNLNTPIEQQMPDASTPEMIQPSAAPSGEKPETPSQPALTLEQKKEIVTSIIDGPPMSGASEAAKATEELSALQQEQ